MVLDSYSKKGKVANNIRTAAKYSKRADIGSLACQCKSLKGA